MLFLIRLALCLKSYKTITIQFTLLHLTYNITYKKVRMFKWR
jgi:hypothetical protein